MIIAVLVAVGVPLALIALGAVILGQAIASLRRRSASRTAAILGVVSGAGVIGCAPVSAAGLVVEVHYGVIIFPLLGMVGALVWGAGLLGAAVVVELVTRRGRSRE